ncbi:hypothetical protein CL622_02935 [archaeon]|nr:hypothetical protein [archaeon]|tara:strand:+ start:4889 stop:5125 length:237 start_codon:yes stop_codon:yes gene_type:complete
MSNTARPQRIELINPLDSILKDKDTTGYRAIGEQDNQVDCKYQEKVYIEMDDTLNVPGSKDLLCPDQQYSILCPLDSI